MPRKKPEQAAPEAITAPPAPVSIPIDDAPSAWSSLMQELGADADATIDVYAEPEKGQGGAEWVCSVNASDFPQLSDLLAYVKAHPDGGPGLYSLRMKQGGKFRGAPRVRIAGRRPPPLPPGAVPVTPAPAAASSGEANEFTKFLQTMVITLLGKQAPEPPKGPGFGEVIEAARLMAGSGKERTPISELKELLSLRDLLSPKSSDDEGATAGPGDDWLTAAIKTFGPAIAATAITPPSASAPQPQPMQRPAPIAPPRPVVAPAAPQPPAPTTPAPQVNPLAPLLGLLIRGAASDGDPAAYASVALDLLGDFAPALLGRPDALDQLMTMAPAAVPHREWFGELLQAAREMLEADAAEATQGGGLTGAETGPDGPGHVGHESAAVP